MAGTDNMERWPLQLLDDKFTQIRFQRFDSVVFKKVIESHLFVTMDFPWSRTGRRVFAPDSK